MDKIVQVHFRMEEKRKTDLQIELMRSGQTIQGFFTEVVNALFDSGQTSTEFIDELKSKKNG